MAFYFISPAEHTETILKNGIEADSDGAIQIYSPWAWINLDNHQEVLTSDILASHVHAWGEYAVFYLHPKGLKAAPEEQLPDLNYPYRETIRLVRQPRIAPSYLKLIGTREPDYGQIGKFHYEPALPGPEPKKGPGLITKIRWPERKHLALTQSAATGK